MDATSEGDRRSPFAVRWFLREWRMAKGMTLAQLAERLNTSAGFLSDLENGKRRMNDGWMGDIAHAIGVEPIDLLRDPAVPTIDEQVRALAPSDRELVLRLIDRLSVGER
jgi:transcriptional regulator with XRE-family HTH domain